MYNYYCKNCKNIIGKWDNLCKNYMSIGYCITIKSQNNNLLYFLDCKKCNKFVGLIYEDVCENCFGKNPILGEKNLIKWFLIQKKMIEPFLNNKYFCKICNNDTDTFRWQHWFFKELTFYK